MVNGYSFWTFCEIVEESGQDSDEFHGGFGLMTQHGIPKAPYRAFELLHKLDGELYETVCREKTVDVYAVDNAGINALQLMAVNHNSLLHAIDGHEVSLRLSTDKKCVRAEIIRIDGTHANAFEKWKDGGSKKYLSKGSVEILKGASELIREPLEYENTNSGIDLSFHLPAMGTALINIYFN